MNNIIIAPSILSSDFANLESEIKKVEKDGADWIHVDVMDGHFVPNITIGAPVVKSIRKVTSLPLDVHLMIETPEKYIKDFANAGADIITIHYEACANNINELINLIKSFGKKVGISIKPKTPASVLTPYINNIDLILIMTVEPGFGGQKFMPDCAEKITEIKQIAPKQVIIEVDGGINKETAKYCILRGANVLVAGSYIFSADNIKETINSLEDIKV